MSTNTHNSTKEKLRKDKFETVQFFMGKRIMCFRILEWIFEYFYITLIANALLYWGLCRWAEGPFQGFMDYLGLVIMPIIMYISEMAMLVIGGLAEIPAEMIAESIFPRDPEELMSEKKTRRKVRKIKHR